MKQAAPSSLLTPDGWVVLHNLVNGTGNFDHLVLGVLPELQTVKLSAGGLSTPDE